VENSCETVKIAYVDQSHSIDPNQLGKFADGQELIMMGGKASKSFISFNFWWRTKQKVSALLVENVTVCTLQ
jgi:hypothetical protein